MELAELKKYAGKMKDSLDIWEYAVEAIEAIEANKAFLVRSKVKEAELAGNEKEIEVVQGNISKARGELAIVEGKVAERNQFLIDGYKAKEQEMKSALEISAIETRDLLEVDLEGLRDDVRKEKESLRAYREQVAMAKTNLRDIQDSIQGMFIK